MLVDGSSAVSHEILEAFDDKSLAKVLLADRLGTRSWRLFGRPVSVSYTGACRGRLEQNSII